VVEEAGTRPIWWPPGRVRLLVLVAAILGLVPWVLYVNFYDVAFDAHAYFVARSGDLYGSNMGTPDAYLYSPAFSQAIEPLRSLGWDQFRQAWRLMELSALAILSGPFAGPLLYVHPVSLEFNMGNIHLLSALAVVASFRFPATWAFVLLTKVTPGVGLLWFAARREWRNVAIALGTTGAVIGLSLLFSPGDWLAWLGVLGSPQEPPPGSFTIVTAPLAARLAAAAALVWWGAHRNYRWTVLAAVMIAQPSVWQHTLSMALGFFWLVRTPSVEHAALSPQEGDPVPVQVVR